MDAAPGSEGGNSAPESGARRRALLHPASEIERGPERETSRTPRRTSDEEPVAPDDPMVSTHDELKSLVAKELGKFLPAHVTKCVHKQSQDLRVRIQALQRTNDRRKKLLDEITILRSGQLPPSVRKVSHSFETYLLDSPACQEGLSWQISPGDTIRAAKEKCHFSHHLAQKQLDLQLVDLHRSKLKEHVKRTNFVQRCSEFFQNCEAPAQTSCSILDIDDDDTDNVVTHELGMTELQFQSTVVSLYKKSIDGEAAKVLLDKASGDKKQERKKKFLEQVANKGPEDFLKETIDERLKLLTSKKGAIRVQGKEHLLLNLQWLLSSLTPARFPLTKPSRFLLTLPCRHLRRKLSKNLCPSQKAKGFLLLVKVLEEKDRKARAKARRKESLLLALTKEKAKTSQKTSCPPWARGMQSPKERALVAKKAGTNGPVERGPTGGSETKTNVQLVLAHGWRHAFAWVFSCSCMWAKYTWCHVLWPCWPTSEAFCSNDVTMACRMPIGTSQPQTCSWWLANAFFTNHWESHLHLGTEISLAVGDWRISSVAVVVLHSKKPYLHPCDVPMPSAVEKFFTEVKTSFYREVMKIRHRSCRFHSKFSNVFGIIRFALECLRQGPYPCTQNRQRRWILPCVKRSFETRDRVGFEHWFALHWGWFRPWVWKNLIIGICWSCLLCCRSCSSWRWRQKRLC